MSLNTIPLKDRIFFATVYFVQGAVGLAGLAKLFFLKDEIGLNEVQFATLAAISLIPFTIKPLYGLISDFFPIFGRRRKFYILLGSALNAGSWYFLSTGVDQYWPIFCAFIGINLGLAIVDVIADGMVVERSDKETVGKLQTLCWGSLSIAGLLTAVAGGYLVQIFSPQKVFLITAFLPLLTFIQGCLISDPKIIEDTHSNKEVKTLEVFCGILGINIFLATIFFFTISYLNPQTAMTENFASSVTFALIVGNIATVFLLDRYVQPFPKRLFLGAVLFLFLWRAMPNIGAQFSYFIINELKWDSVFLGYVDFVSNIGKIIGAILFWVLFDRVSLRKIFFWTILIASAAGFLNLVFVYQPAFLTHFTILDFPGIMVFALSTELILGILFYVGFLPLFKLAAQIVPKGVEATMFALVASFMNLGLLVSTWSGGHLGGAMGVVDGNYENLDTLIITATCVNLVLLPLLFLIPKQGTHPVLNQTSTSE